MVLSAALLATIPWHWGEEVGKEWLKQACVLLVVSCPCALVISTPVSYVCALASSAANGVLIKGGCHLEVLGRLTAIAFDKTGTLTEGNFVLRALLGFVPDDADASKVEVEGEIDKAARERRQSMLKLLLSVEQRSSHPMANALCDAAKSEGVSAATSVEQVVTLAGEGVQAVVDGQLVQIGSSRMARRLGWLSGGKAGANAAAASGGISVVPAVADLVDGWEATGATVGWLGVDHKPVGVFSVADTMRSESREALELLKQMGIETIMCTGDSQGAADGIASQLPGLTAVRAQLLPKDKVTEVTALLGSHAQRFGRSAKVAMVGDGINDAPALAAANVGIAMGAAGTPVAMETADVALMDSDLRKLAWAVKLGRRTLGKIRQNVVLSISIKLVMIVLTAVKLANLWLAIATDLGAMLLVTLNGMTLLDPPKKKGKVAQRSAKKQAVVTGAELEDTLDTMEGGHAGGGCCAHDHSHGHGHDDEDDNKGDSGHDHGHSHGHFGVE